MTTKSIVSILNKLRALHESLYTVSMKKTDILKRGTVTELDELLKEEQSHLAAIVRLDEQREQLVTAYVERATNERRSSRVTMTDLIDVAPEEEQQALVEARERLVETIERLQVQNELNQQLTFQSLQFVNLSLGMVRPQEQTTMNYSKDEVQGIRQSKGLGSFDSQA